MDNIIQVLTTVPVSDGNFRSVLLEATNNQIRDAIKQMQDEMSHGAKHKSRINACMSELLNRNGCKMPRKRKTRQMH